MTTPSAGYRSLLTGAALNLSPLKLIATGGEASVYAIGNRPDLLFKLYKEVNPKRTAKVSAMLKAPPRQDPVQPFVAWPIDGVLPPTAPDARGVLIPYGRNTLTLLGLITLTGAP